MRVNTSSLVPNLHPSFNCMKSGGEGKAVEWSLGIKDEACFFNIPERGHYM